MPASLAGLSPPLWQGCRPSPSGRTPLGWRGTSYRPSPERMLRLLQGDVGSGKTMVALLALASVVEAGHQGALMAPTEILARQHYGRLKPLAESAGLRVALLTGREK